MKEQTIDRVLRRFYSYSGEPISEHLSWMRSLEEQDIFLELTPQEEELAMKMARTERDELERWNAIHKGMSPNWFSTIQPLNAAQFLSGWRHIEYSPKNKIKGVKKVILSESGFALGIEYAHPRLGSEAEAGLMYAVAEDFCKSVQETGLLLGNKRLRFCCESPYNRMYGKIWLDEGRISHPSGYDDIFSVKKNFDGVFQPDTSGCFELPNEEYKEHKLGDVSLISLLKAYAVSLTSVFSIGKDA